MNALERSSGMQDSDKQDNEVKDLESKERMPVLKERSTWFIFIVGLVMLLFGIFLGYYGRPLVGPEARTAMRTGTAQAVAVKTQVAANKKIMEYLSGKLQHFQGDTNAPVTIIEFSDYQ
jgi:amino acid transporter